MTDTGISPKWSNMAVGWLGNKDGRHCHWCRSIRHDDGCSYCDHPQSKFNDGDRIRTWDGEYCAKKCKYFKLDDGYKDDENLDSILKPKENPNAKETA